MPFQDHACTAAARHAGASAAPCPLCASSLSRTLRRFEVRHAGLEGEFQLRQCDHCELVYISPRPDDQLLSRLYGEEFYFPKDSPFTGIASGVQDLIQDARRGVVEKRSAVGRLLDVGSGDGTFVHHMTSHGWDATGLDFSPAARELALRKQLRGSFLQGSLTDIDLPAGSFDAITLWQVLEHIGEPLQVLRRVKELLRPGGLFVASVPNIEGLSAVLTGDRWWGLDVPRHLVHYTPRTLRRAVLGAGLQVVDIRHFSFQYDPYALLHSSLDWAFTRRHFLSDLAKSRVDGRMSPLEYGYNLTALAVLGPLLAPFSLLATTTGACLRHGGFIEIIARRE